LGRSDDLEGRSVTDRMSVVLVGLDERLEEQLTGDEGFDVSRAPTLDEVAQGVDAVVVRLDDGQPLETVRALRSTVPEAAIVVVTDQENATDGTVAMHAGAEDHLISDSVPDGLLPRAVRYAVAVRRLRREVTAQDQATGLPNLRGFGSIAEHHLRMADRSGRPVVFVFVRLDGLAALAAEEGGARADELVRASADVVLEAVRSSDVPARVSDDTFCVLLTGDSEGAEGLVLSRLVEAIASRAGEGSPLALSVGTALYEPGSGATLEAILEAAGRRLAESPSAAP
jgi:diguanylate cyclase (GGDEF)-like protein